MNAAPLTAASACWARILAASVRQVLDRLDTTVTLSEAKDELSRELVARRQTWESDCLALRPCQTHA